MCDVSRKEESRGKESTLVGGRGIEEERMGLGERRDARGHKAPLVGNNKHVVETANGSDKTAL